MIADGIHGALRYSEYDRIERVNISLLKWMSKSPAHYLYALTHPEAEEDTDAKKIGRVAHIAVFEPERFRNSIAVWDGGRRYGKDWNQFCERNDGKELLTEDEYALCQALQASVRASPLAAPYLQGGRGEVSMAWSASVEGGDPIACKGRVDFDGQVLADLKTTRDASAEAFGRQAFSLNYHVRAAWYTDAYELLTGIRKPFVIIAAEKQLGYEIAAYVVTEPQLRLGRAVYTSWLDRLQRCRATACWPGYADRVTDLQLPPWALPFDEADPTGLGLETGGV